MLPACREGSASVRRCDGDASGVEMTLGVRCSSNFTLKAGGVLGAQFKSLNAAYNIGNVYRLLGLFVMSTLHKTRMKPTMHTTKTP